MKLLYSVFILVSLSSIVSCGNRNSRTPLQAKPGLKTDIKEEKPNSELNLPDGCRKECLTKSAFCTAISKTAVDKYADDLEALYKAATKLEVNQQGVFNLDNKGIRDIEFKLFGGISILATFEALKPVLFKREDSEYLRLQISSESPPLLTFQNKDLDPELGGQLLSIEFVETKPIFEFQPKPIYKSKINNCIYIN